MCMHIYVHTNKKINQKNFNFSQSNNSNGILTLHTGRPEATPPPIPSRAPGQLSPKGSIPYLCRMKQTCVFQTDAAGLLVILG